jgi:hypothetical protein
MSIGSTIAEIGENPDFIAFNAHWGFAFFALTAAARFHLPYWPCAVVALALAAVKEFWFDPRYETDQNIWPDGVEDFVGYATGIALAAVL